MGARTTHTRFPSLSERIDRSHPIARGLRAAWLLTEPGGRVYDALGVIHGDASGGPVRAIHAEGRGLTFDGSDDYVSFGAPTLLDFTSAMTIIVWIRIPTTPATNGSYISKGGYYNAAGSWAFNYQLDNTHRFTIANSFYGVNASTPSFCGPMRMVAVSFDKSRASDQLQFTVDGGRFSSAVATHTTDVPVTTKVVRLGMDVDYAETFAHTTYGAMLWDRALSLAEIRALDDDRFMMLERRNRSFRAPAAASTIALHRANAGLRWGPFAHANAGVGAIA